MKLKKYFAPPEELREAFDSINDVRNRAPEDWVFAPSIHEEKRTAPAKILVISHHPDGRSVLRKELQAAHYDVITAENETEGMNLVMTIQPDLILLDMTHSLTDGIRIGVRLKNNSATRPIPLVFLTTGEGLEEVMTGLGLGPADDVVRPYRLNELRNSIRKTLARRDEQRRFRREFRRFKSDFIAMASNEIRNQVTVIAGFASLLEQKMDRLESSVRQAYLKEVLQHADYLANLTDGFDCLLSPETTLREMVAARIVWAAAEKFRARIEQKGQHLVLKPAQPEPLFLHGNDQALSTAVGLLVSHAHKFADPGGTITVEIVPAGDHVRIEVAPAGIDMEGEQDENWDLGLIMARSIAERHHGRMGGVGRPGPGNRFWIELPVKDGSTRKHARNGRGR